jgi:hypothetical protein
MNKEFIEIRQRSDPTDAEETDGRPGPDPRDEPAEVPAVGQSHPAPLGEPLEGARQDEARSGNEVAFSQHQVGGEVMSGPAPEQGGSGRAELIEKVTELEALLRV